MIGVMSLWTRTPRFRMNFSLAMLYSAACAYLGKNFQDTELVTDDHGLEIADRLRWEFTSYRKTLNNLVPVRMRHCWMLGKLAASVAQTERHVHVDLDLLVMAPLPSRLAEARCFVQGKDQQHIYKDKLMAEMLRHAGIGPEVVPYNTGLIGWTDLRARDEYIKEAWYAAVKLCGRYREDHYGTAISVVAEQAVLARFATKKRVKVAEAIPMFTNATDVDFSDFPFCHMWGSSKLSGRNLAKVERRFRQDFPEKFRDFVTGFDVLLKKGLV